MVMRCEREFEIEDLRNHPEGMILMEPDPKRPGFYEVESGETVYYIHVSPVTGKILLLETWPSEAAAMEAPQAA